MRKPTRFKFRKTFDCSFAVSSKGPHAIVTVSVKGVGTKRTQLGEGPLAMLVRTMVRDIFRDAASSQTH